jgi:hypothetical protein
MISKDQVCYRDGECCGNCLHGVGNPDVDRCIKHNFRVITTNVCDIFEKV